MADWNNFLRSDDFKTYRKKQIEMVASHLQMMAKQSVSNGKVDLPALQGKLEMIRLFVRFPETLTQDKQLQELLSIQMDEDTAHIAQYLIRLTLAE